MSGYVIPFGKHKGLPISEAPSSWVTWGAENLNHAELKAECAKEAARRRGGDNPGGIGRPTPLVDAAEARRPLGTIMDPLEGAAGLADKLDLAAAGATEAAMMLRAWVRARAEAPADEVPF